MILVIFYVFFSPKIIQQSGKTGAGFFIYKEKAYDRTCVKTIYVILCFITTKYNSREIFIHYSPAKLSPRKKLKKCRAGN